MSRYSRKPRLHSVKWEGFEFVKMTSRPREVVKVVSLDRIYASTPSGKIAVDASSSIFSGADLWGHFVRVPEALQVLGLIDDVKRDELIAKYKKQEDKRNRLRYIRDLRDSLEILELDPAPDQSMLLAELDQ